jgi:PleD family two-component response regulator
MVLKYCYKQATQKIRHKIKLDKLIDIPIIALSAQDDTEIVNRALNAGASEYGKQISSLQANSDEQIEGDTHQIFNYLIRWTIVLRGNYIFKFIVHNCANCT